MSSDENTIKDFFIDALKKGNPKDTVTWFINEMTLKYFDFCIFMMEKYKWYSYYPSPRYICHGDCNHEADTDPYFTTRRRQRDA